jgi:sorting and assembly machinery component 37
MDAEKSSPNSSTGQIPKSLLKKPQETVISLLAQEQHQNQFRLDAITSVFLGPLDDLLGRKPFLLLENQLSSLDCLAVGHLSLALYPALPHPFLQTALKEKFPRLASYTERVSKACFGNPVDPKAYLTEVSSDPRRKSYESAPLPWRPEPTRSFTDMGIQVLENFADSIPILSQFRANNRLRHAAADPGLEDIQKNQLSTLSRDQRRELYAQICTVVGGISAFIGYLFYVGLFSIESDEEEEEIEGDGSFGEAGELLGLGSVRSVPRTRQDREVRDEPLPNVTVEIQPSDGPEPRGHI